MEPWIESVTSAPRMAQTLEYKRSMVLNNEQQPSQRCQDERVSDNLELDSIATSTSPPVDMFSDLSLSPSAPQPSSPHLPDPSPPPFDRVQCLFCHHKSVSFPINLAHMSNSHGLLIPDVEHLLVDPETLVKYAHLVVFGYFECLYCGSERSSLRAVQQHMVGRGHCKFNIREGSEFADFWDWEETHEEGSGEEEGVELVDSRQSAIRIDEQSLRLQSGKVLSHRLATTVKNKKRGRRVTTSDQVVATVATPPHSTPVQSQQEPETSSKRVAKLTARFDHHLSTLRAEDKRSIMHLPTYQQRAVVAKGKAQVERARREENAMLLKIQLQANKTLKG